MDASHGSERPVLPILTSLDAPRIEGMLKQEEFFWIDLVEPSEEEVRTAGSLFGLHPLSIEDTLSFGQRPKFEDYDGYAQLVFYGVDGVDAELGLVEVHVYVTGDFVFTVRRQACDAVDSLHRTLAQTWRGVEVGVVYRIVDALTDSFFPVLSDIDDAIDMLEDAILSGPTDEQLHEIFALKRRLVHLRKVVTPQRDLLARATDRIVDLPGLGSDERDYFRDTYDHMIRVSDMIDTQRDLLTGAMDVYLSTIANKQNDVMRQLSIIATIFLPLTFVTGFFGQNFGWMVRNVSTGLDFAAWGIGSLAISCVLLAGFFWRRGWF